MNKRLNTFNEYLLFGMTLLAVMLFTFASFIPIAWAQSDRSKLPISPRTQYVYSAKFTCVPEVGPAANVGSGVPFTPTPVQNRGIISYRTAVNVHNFFKNKTVTFTKKAVLARSEDLKRGPISQQVTERLLPDEALSIDCLDIQKLFGGRQSIGDGFVVIYSNKKLDVAAVYTSTYTDGATINKIVFTLKGPKKFFQSYLSLKPGEQGEIIVPGEIGKVQSVQAMVRNAINQNLKKQDKKPLPSIVKIKIIDVEFGVGLSAGQSIDVEYIHPKKLDY